jgi:hypothetical protein
MKPQTYSSRDLIMGISKLPKLSRKLIGNGYEYEKLLLTILELTKDQDAPLPLSKSLIQICGIRSYHCTKWLHDIWADLAQLMQDENNPQFEANRIEHHLDCALYNGLNFTLVTSLSETPMIGHRLNLDFLIPLTEITTFYVQDIYYDLLDGKMVVHVRLTNHFYNTYSKFEDDKELAEAYDMGTSFYLDVLKKRLGLK